MPLYTIPAGLLVSICRADDESRRWMPHTMQVTLTGKQVVGGRHGAALFSHEGWLILTRVWRVTRESGGSLA